LGASRRDKKPIQRIGALIILDILVLIDTKGKKIIKKNRQRRYDDNKK
jgi:hypothetical protein